MGKRRQKVVTANQLTEMSASLTVEQVSCLQEPCSCFSVEIFSETSPLMLCWVESKGINLCVISFLPQVQQGRTGNAEKEVENNIIKTEFKTDFLALVGGRMKAGPPPNR